MGRIKQGLVVGLFSVFISAVLIGGVYFCFGTEAMEHGLPKASVLVLDDRIVAWKEEDFGKNRFSFSGDEFVPVEQIDSFYKNKTLQSIGLFSLFFVVFVFLSMGCLIKVLKYLEEKHIQLAQDTAKNMAEWESDQRHGMDYHRLNAYIAHEQKNALSLLKAKLQLNHLDEYVKDIDKLSNKLDDVLTISGKQQDVIGVDATLVAAKVVDEYKKIYPQLDFQFEEDGDTMIDINDIYLHRALTNLIENAVKFGKDKPISVQVEVKQNSVILSVKDQGIGIGESQINHIFQDSFRVGELKKDGYGIGLSVVKYVCDISGGFCYVESEKQKGTTFYLAFPQSKH